MSDLRIGGPPNDVIVRMTTEEGEVAVTHPRPDGDGRCTAWFDGTTHRITSEVPLAIEPSLDCPECGWHHTITNGEVR